MTYQDSDHKNLFDLVQKMLESMSQASTALMVQCFPFFSPLKGRKRGQAPAAKQAESQGPKELKHHCLLIWLCCECLAF